jgi:hypothetical protein
MPVRPGSSAILPDAVDGVLAIALAKEGGARFSCCVEFAEALQEVSEGRANPALDKRARKLLRERPWGTSGILLQN